MARSDLLINLVRSKAMGDDRLFEKTVEAIIAEERNKQHHVLANQLATELKSTPPTKSGPIAFGSKINSLFVETTPERQIEDLVLQPSVRCVFDEIIEEQQRVELLRSYNLEPRHRILLYGKPGNGKTTVAEAIAESLSVPLLTVRYEGLITSYLGETNQRLKQIFDHVRTAKCVLFFDEFDTIGKERGDVHDTGEIKRVVSSLLLQIDALPSHVVVVASSNHPELLDRAVWRRFQAKLELTNPTAKEIENWFELFEKRVNLKFGLSHTQIASALAGRSFSEVEDFALNVVRRYVLEKPESTLSSVVKRQLAAIKANGPKVAKRNAR